MEHTIWKDRKRILGLPISFTKYKLTDDQLYIQTGLLNLRTESVKLFRVMDISLTQPLLQRLFHCGTLTLHSTDSRQPTIQIQFVKDAVNLYKLLDSLVDRNRHAMNVRTTEFLGEEQT